MITGIAGAASPNGPMPPLSLASRTDREAFHEGTERSGAFQIPHRVRNPPNLSRGHDRLRVAREFRFRIGAAHRAADEAGEIVDPLHHHTAIVQSRSNAVR